MRYNKRYAIIKYGFNEQPVSLTKEQIPTLEEIADCDYKNIRVLDFTDVEHSMRFNPMQHLIIWKIVFHHIWGIEAEQKLRMISGTFLHETLWQC